REGRYLPPPVVRYYLYDRYLARDWESLRDEALRYLFHARPSHDNQLALWMLSQAAARLPGIKPVGAVATIHPLRITPERDIENLIGEFSAAVEANELDRACRILTRSDVADSLASGLSDPDLFQSAAGVLQDLIEAHPRFQDWLKENYAAVGRIRLNRSVEQGRYDQLEQIATQFHGTEASRLAMIISADRALSSGAFSRAAQRYRKALRSTSGSEHVNITAKLNLALALMGKRPAQPVTTGVRLPGGSFTSQQYNGILQRLYEERSGEVGDPADRERFPEPGEVRVSPVVDLELYRAFPYGVAQQGNHLVLQQKDLVCAVSLDEKKMLWSHGKAGKSHNSPCFRPAVGSDFVVAVMPDDLYRRLSCFDLASGELRWEKTFDGPVTSSPILHLGNLYVLTQSEDRYMTVHRLNPGDGRTAFSRFILPDHTDEKRPTPKQLIMANDRILISDNGMLIACDEGGEVEWIRRFPYISPEIDRGLPLRDLHQELLSWRVGSSVTPALRTGLVLPANRLVLCSPGSPYVGAIGLEGGAVEWSVLLPRRQYFFGRAGSSILLRNIDSIQAIDEVAGEMLWKIPVEEGATYGMDAAGRYMLVVHLERMDQRKNHQAAHRTKQRTVRWISTATGEVEREVEIHDMGDEIFSPEYLIPWAGKAV
ncbi:MAG: PQQ-binding-like beta-propeller repeat protein, partial [Verrucomicrobiota bacterium]